MKLSPKLADIAVAEIRRIEGGRSGGVIAGVVSNVANSGAAVHDGQHVVPASPSPLGGDDPAKLA